MYTLEDIQAVDPEIAAAITAEFDRQNSHIELIASENWVSPAVMSAMGSILTNKYAEGYPGKRYYGGCECVDVVEELARERAKKLFGCEYVNVQPHSGAQANMAVQFAILKPGDTIMGMNLDHGGHLTHGSPVNFSGTYFHVVPYGVNDEGFIDYDKVREIALECKPKMIIAGASAYARTIDFKKFREIADEVNAVLMVDMAHIAGLVAAGLHPSPVPYADVVTTTTHKTLRGPRGGMILCSDEVNKKYNFNKAIFPGTQGGPLMHVIAAKAVCFEEALKPEFKEYQTQIVKNAQALCKGLQARDIKIVSGGTDNHLMLVDLTLRASRNKLSKQIGALMGQGKKDEAEEVKAQVAANAARLSELEAQEKELSEKVTKIMMTIPNIIDPSVPIGKDDSCNVEIEKFGDPYVPDFEIPYHTDIMERFDGIDLDAAGKVAGNGFYYLMGDIARIHSSVIAYARDFMINRGFTYCVPPFMIRSNVVTGVMSFDEMDAMMYKIEGEDLYLIGTSEHSMIGKFIDTINDEEKLPYTLTSYSPCFRKEKGAHGIEERGVYRIHQFEKQEMIVVCKPEESKAWYDKLWKNTVDLFRSLDIPVRTLECCSGDLADLKVKSCDVEAWSPRQKKYFEVGSCSNLGDAQARRLKIRIKGKDGRKYFAHTLNNTVVAPPRMLIAFLENNLNEDGSVNIPKALQPYMGGIEKIVPKHE